MFLLPISAVHVAPLHIEALPRCQRLTRLPLLLREGDLGNLGTAALGSTLILSTDLAACLA